jgi:hypothetical protein
MNLVILLRIVAIGVKECADNLLLRNGHPRAIQPAVIVITPAAECRRCLLASGIRKRIWAAGEPHAPGRFRLGRVASPRSC